MLVCFRQETVRQTLLLYVHWIKDRFLHFINTDWHLCTCLYILSWWSITKEMHVYARLYTYTSLSIWWVNTKHIVSLNDTYAWSRYLLGSFIAKGQLIFCYFHSKIHLITIFYILTTITCCWITWPCLCHIFVWNRLIKIILIVNEKLIINTYQQVSMHHNVQI